MYPVDNTHKSKVNKFRTKKYLEKKIELYKMLLNVFHKKSFPQFVKFVNQISVFHVHKQLILNGDELDEIRFVNNHLN